MNNGQENNKKNHDETIPSLFVQETWLKNHEYSDHDVQRTWVIRDLFSKGDLSYQVIINLT